MNGEIYIESQVGVGSKFTCLIPLQKPLLEDDFGCEPALSSIEAFSDKLVPELKVTASLSSEEEDPCHSSASSVLLVEDNTMAATIAKAMLATFNCQVDIAPDGKTAIELAEAKTYDLIFMDIGLPDIDGYEVTKRIRLYESTQEGVQVPIIALTAHIDEENKESCTEAGMDAFLKKPLTNKALTAILKIFIPSKKES